MTRTFTEDRLVVASHNKGKVSEIAALMAPYAIDVISAVDINLPEPEEDGENYIANATIKARAAAIASGLPALSDDSGFEVMAINRDPGLYSARWAGPDKDFSLAMAKVYAAVEASGSNDRNCRFVCALALCWPDGVCVTTEGYVDGQFIWPPRGDKGFGYDPVFQPNGYDQSFGEVDQDWKHSVSHRAKAFEQLIAQFFQNTKRRG
jgi:XTP/dITP diphosphohydrolase